MRRRYAALAAGGAVAAAALLLGTCMLRPRPAASPSAPGPARGGTPRVVLKETTRDLGILDPKDKCRHAFIVRNDGNAPLKIAKAGTSCKCTVSVLPSGEIPPGMGGPVEIESKTEGIAGAFSHTAGFLTNDPKTPRFELTIKGAIRSYVAANPSSVYLPELARGQPVEASTTITSQVWDAFSLSRVTSNIEGLTWEFRPANPRELQEGKARSGYTATFRLPADRASGGFNGWVEATAQPAGQAQGPRKVRVLLSGRVAPIRSVYGQAVDHKGVVNLGGLSLGEGARTQLLLRVRGEHRLIRFKKIEKQPGFLNVFAESPSRELAKKGLYRIVIEVPRDAPPCNYMLPDRMGEMRVLTDHPEMPEIVKLRIAFAVMTQ